MSNVWVNIVAVVTAASYCSVPTFFHTEIEFNTPLPDSSN